MKEHNLSSVITHYSLCRDSSALWRGPDSWFAPSLVATWWSPRQTCAAPSGGGQVVGRSGSRAPRCVQLSKGGNIGLNKLFLLFIFKFINLSKSVTVSGCFI